MVVKYLVTINKSTIKFEYNPTLVKCESCNVWFEHTKLKSDSNEDSDYSYYFSNTVCPYCGDWDCCQIEYEKMQ